MNNQTLLSVKTIQWIENLEVFTALLLGFRQRQGERVRKWENKGDDDGLVIELAAVLAEADSLSRLVDSIADGTEEKVPMSGLRERFIRLLMKADVLRDRWKSRSKGMER